MGITNNTSKLSILKVQVGVHKKNMIIDKRVYDDMPKNGLLNQLSDLKYWGQRFDAESNYRYELSASSYLTV